MTSLNVGSTVRTASPFSVQLPDSPPETRQGALYELPRSVAGTRVRNVNVAPSPLSVPRKMDRAFSSASSSSASQSPSPLVSPNDPVYISSLTNLLTFNTRAPATHANRVDSDDHSKATQSVDPGNLGFDEEFRKIEEFAQHLQRQRQTSPSMPHADDDGDTYRPVSLVQQQQQMKRESGTTPASDRATPIHLTVGEAKKLGDNSSNMTSQKSAIELQTELQTLKSSYQSLYEQYVTLQEEMDTARQEHQRHLQHEQQSSERARSQARCLDLEQKLHSEREQHRLTQMDSRKTFKLFQDAQQLVQTLTAQAKEDKAAFERELRSIREEYEGALGKNAAHVSSSTDQIELLIKKCDKLSDEAQRLRTENDLLRVSLQKERDFKRNLNVDAGRESPLGATQSKQDSASDRNATKDVELLTAKLRRILMTLMATLGDNSLPSVSTLIGLDPAALEQQIRASLFRFVKRCNKSRTPAAQASPSFKKTTATSVKFSGSASTTNRTAKPFNSVQPKATAQPNKVHAKPNGSAPQYARKGTLFGTRKQAPKGQKPPTNSTSKPASIWAAAAPSAAAAQSSQSNKSGSSRSFSPAYPPFTQPKPGNAPKAPQAKSAAQRQADKMNYYFKRQQRELAARRQREADIADKMRRKKEAQRSQQRTTTEPIKKPNLEQTPRRDGSTTSPPPPPSSATHSAPDANRVKSQSHRSPGGTDLGNWVCVTREDGTVYYFHKVTKTVRWNRPEDHLLGQIEKEIGKQQRDVASRQTQRIQEMRHAEEEQKKQVEERERVMATANISKRVNNWASKKTLPQLLRTVHQLLPNLVPAHTVGADRHSVKSVRRQYLAVLRKIHPDKLSSSASSKHRVSIVEELLAQEIVSLLTSKYQTFPKH